MSEMLVEQQIGDAHAETVPLRAGWLLDWAWIGLRARAGGDGAGWRG